MARTQTATILQHIRSLLVTQAARESSDSKLLDRFSVHHDEQAFAALLHRHGGLVWGVCRHILRNEHDAEDAFQATFLVLARRAGSIRKGASLASWLYGVAYRVAVRARKRADQRERMERLAASRANGEAHAVSTTGELGTLLNDELRWLPQKQRIAFVLCCLQGKSRKEAAAELRWKEGTLASRLDRARAVLRERLARRGVAPALVAGALSPDLYAGAPAVLAANAVRAGILVGAGKRVSSAGLSGSALALADAVSRAMALTNVCWTLGFLLVVGVLAGAVGLVAVQPPVAGQPSPQTQKDQSRPDRREEASKPVAGAQRTDRYGDPLPPEALARLGTVRFRAEEYSQSLAYTPDGRTIVSAGHGGVRIWEAATGKLIRRLGGELEQAFGPAGLSPDGKLVAVGGWGSTQGGAVYEIASGRRLYRFGFPSSNVMGTFSPDGKILAAYPRNDDAIVLLNAANGKTLRAFQAKIFNSGPMTPEVVFAPDSKTLVSAGSDGFVRVWEVATGTELRRFKAASKAVSSMSLSPDGSHVATVGLTVLGQAGGPSTSFPDNDVRLYDLTSGQERRRFVVPATQTEKGRPIGPSVLRFTPDGKGLLTGGWAQPLRVWDEATGRELRQLDSRVGALAIACAPGAKTIAVAEGHSIRLRDLASGRDLAPTGGHRNSINVVAISSDGRTIATGGDDRDILLWDLASGKERRLAGHRDAVGFLSYSLDGRTLYSGGRDETFRAWEVGTGRELRCVELGARIGSLSRDGRTVATLAPKQGVLLRDAATGQVRRTLEGPRTAFPACPLAPTTSRFLPGALTASCTAGIPPAAATVCGISTAWKTRPSASCFHRTGGL